MIETVHYDGQDFALILRRGPMKPGTKFFTDPDQPLQLGTLNHARGTEITPHYHTDVERPVKGVQEVLVLVKGRLRVDFFDGEQSLLGSRILEAGDTIVLTGGGHGFEVLDDVEMIEVKTGPYMGDEDKTRFGT